MQLHKGQEQKVVGQILVWSGTATPCPFLIGVLGKFKNILLYLYLSWAPADEPLFPSSPTSQQGLEVPLPFPCGKEPSCNFLKLTFS